MTAQLDDDTLNLIMSHMTLGGDASPLPLPASASQCNASAIS